MPFLQTCAAPRQLRVRALTRRAGALAAVAGAIGLLPAALIRTLIRWQDPRMDGASVAATAALLRRDVALVALRMGASEFEDLAGESGWAALEAVAASGRCASTLPWVLLLAGAVYVLSIACSLTVHDRPMMISSFLIQSRIRSRVYQARGVRTLMLILRPVAHLHKTLHDPGQCIDAAICLIRHALAYQTSACRCIRSCLALWPVQRLGVQGSGCIGGPTLGSFRQLRTLRRRHTRCLEPPTVLLLHPSVATAM